MQIEQIETLRHVAQNIHLFRHRSRGGIRLLPGAGEYVAGQFEGLSNQGRSENNTMRPFTVDRAGSCFTLLDDGKQLRTLGGQVQADPDRHNRRLAVVPERERSRSFCTLGPQLSRRKLVSSVTGEVCNPMVLNQPVVGL